MITNSNCDLIHCCACACDITNLDYAHIHRVLWEDIRIGAAPDRRAVYQTMEDQQLPGADAPEWYPCAMRCNAFHHPEYS